MTQITKKALAASLKKLLQEKPMDKVTVVDIVENCGVNRQTFYYHFRDIYEFFASNFWLYWRTMFAFEDWHSALEMKHYIQRFIHHIGGLPDFSALKFTKFNQYESLILPMVKYLEAHNVDFQYDTKVTNVIFDINKDKKTAKKLPMNVQVRKNIWTLQKMI